MDRLEDGGNPLPAADAERRQPVALLPAPELAEKREDEPRPGGAHRMAERDRAAVDVGLLPVEPEFPLDGWVLGRKRLVALDQIHVPHPEPGAASVRVGAGTGPIPMTSGAAPHARIRPGGLGGNCFATRPVGPTTAAAIRLR